MSPLLFIVYMDIVTRKANPNLDDLNELLFADDQGLLNKCQQELQTHTVSLNATCEDHYMKISTDKSEVIPVSKSPSPLLITISGTTLKQIQQFKYLCSILMENGKLDRGIEIRRQKANNVSYQLAP